MIPQLKLQEYDVPAKDDLTGNIDQFTVVAYSWSQASSILERHLDAICFLRWRVGWGSM